MTKKARVESSSYTEADVERALKSLKARGWKPGDDDGAGLLRPADAPTHKFLKAPGQAVCNTCGQGFEHTNHGDQGGLL